MTVIHHCGGESKPDPVADWLRQMADLVESGNMRGTMLQYFGLVKYPNPTTHIMEAAHTGLNCVTFIYSPHAHVDTAGISHTVDKLLSPLFVSER